MTLIFELKWAPQSERKRSSVLKKRHNSQSIIGKARFMPLATHVQIVSGNTLTKFFLVFDQTLKYLHNNTADAKAIWKKYDNSPTCF